MDIIRVLTFIHLKASLETLKPKQKFFLGIFVFALLLNLIPHKTYALTIKAPTANKPILVFDTSDKGYMALLSSIKLAWVDNHKNEQQRQQAVRQGKLASKVGQYLSVKKSPLAEYSSVLVSVKNWKQIVALANAESTLCKRYITATANCWGVGGSKLWDFGNDLGDGILGMNNFLTNYPARSKIKYSHMTFEQMNGLYKQPAAPHWLYNVEVIYDELSALEKSL